MAVYVMQQKNDMLSYRQGPKNDFVQHWNFARPIFQANQALTDKVVELALLSTANEFPYRHALTK